MIITATPATSTPRFANIAEMYVPTAGTVYHKLVKGMDDPKSEPPILMAKAVLLLTSEPADKVNGRVTYSQQILSEYGQLGERKPTGRGVTEKGTGYSQI